SVDVARYARHVALPEIGPAGQARICAARVAVIGTDRAAETAITYLRAAGVGEVVTIGAEEKQGGREEQRMGWGPDPEPSKSSLPPLLPVNSSSLLADVDLVVRTNFDDDAMMGAANQLGLPVIAVRAQRDGVDMVAFSGRLPAPGAAIAPFAAAAPPDD